MDVFTPSFALLLAPRASALAEVLSTDPEENFYEVDSRMLMHREYLVANGIRAEPLKPEWCLQNENECSLSNSQTGLVMEKRNLANFSNSLFYFKMSTSQYLIAFSTSATFYQTYL
uniref:Uncharacterized protein n=1 Tax=Glossina brevipalpis TaxID=37001 RepID=A0A1A9WMQ4_9MUSC